MKIYVSWLAILLLLAVPAAAQLQSGNLLGKVTDEQGSPLPGVTVTLTGGAPQLQVTDEKGEFRFVGLAPGTYGVEARIEGFSPLDYPDIDVNIGRNTNIEITLTQSFIDTITITTEPPLLDERRISTGNTVSSNELEKIPTARDPWAVLQSTPGVLTDRMNVGGNESGQQSQYVGPGSGGDQAVWSLDGVVITDMSATGSSPGYYDFDAFEEMQVTTGGSDASIATGGVTLNMVTKRGTNEWRGSGRYLVADESSQSDLELDNSEFGQPGPWNNNTPQAAFTQGNRIITVEDWGAELGGPIVKDRLWAWGSYAKPEIDLRTAPATGFPEGVKDLTTLEDWNAKVNAQITPNNSATAFAWQSDKVKIGRNAGPTRPQETTWNQSKFGDSPTAYKVEDTHIFSPSFYLTGLYSVVNGGFQLVPQGGDEVPFQDAAGVWHNSFFLRQIGRPQEQYKLDSSYFFNTGSLSHELKFGAGYRTAEQTTLSRTPGGFYEQDLAALGAPPGSGSVYNFARDQFISVDAEYTSAYVQDTLSVGNLTANLGLRYDKQGGDNLPKSIAGNSFVPGVLPAINYAGGPAGFEWESIDPRLGLTYALGAERKTLLRASYSRFSDQLATGFIGFLNPIGAQSYAYYYGSTRGDGTLPGDLAFGSFSSNVNPITGDLIQSNAVASGLDAPTTDELLFSVEHALLPEFVVGLNFTFRQAQGLLETENLVFECAGTSTSCATDAGNLGSVGRAHRRSDYVQRTNADGSPRNLTGTLPNGQAYSIPVYQLRPGLSSRGGLLLENGDREQEYQGLSLVLNKRLSNRWMMRGNLTYADWTWNVPESEEENPTRLFGIVGYNNNFSADGSPVLQNSGTGSGSKGNVWVNSKWSYSLNALYQVAPDRPWGFNVAGNLTGREGYPTVYLENVRLNTRSPLETNSVVVSNDSDSDRLDDLQILDLRLEKDFTFGDFGFTLGVDCFNALNDATVLQRRGILKAANSDHVQEIVSPRIFRIGAKVSFR